LKSWTGRILSALLVLFALYVLAGFLLVPRILRGQLVDNVQRTLGLTPSIGEIRFNPLRLRLDVQDFALPGADGATLVGFGHFAVRAGFASIWRRAIVLQDIELDAPVVTALIDREGRINLMQLKPKPAPQPDEPARPLPRIEVGLLRVTHGSVAFTDQSRTPVFATHVDPIEFDLRDFTTGSEGGLFDFSAATQSAERVEWHGHASLSPLESDGDVAVTGLKAKTIWEYLESQLNFVVSGGDAHLAFHYRASLQGATDVHVDLKQLDVAGLGIRPKGGDRDWISLPELKIGPAAIDLLHRELSVDAVTLRGLRVSASLGADRTLNLMQLAPPPGPAAAPTADAAWHVSLKDFAISEAAVAVEDHGIAPAATFTLQPLSVDVQGLSLDLSRALPVRFATGINGSGRLSVAGTVTPSPLTADVGVQLDGFELAGLQPYIGQATGMILQAGTLGTQLKVRYGGVRPQATVAGDIRVTDLHTVDKALHDDFLNWQSLELKGLAWRQQPSRLELQRVAVQKLYSRAIIEADETLNVQRVLSPGGVIAAPVAAAAASAAAKPSVKPARVPRAGTARTPPAAPAAAGPPAMVILIHSVEIADSTVNFSDLSVTPNFNAGIQKLGGAVTGLSSQPGTRAKVDLKGEVDPFSPVTINGELNVLSPALYSDLSMSFRNIELSIMNPYSGKFAGYNITKGKLTAEMRYRIDGRKLDLDHHIIIDQLEFGDATESKDAVSLPIKLAVSLLKDRNGVIDLPLPVGGSLDDPDFKLSKVVWKVLVNILEKAVTAPFALLGRLFSAGPDLQFIDFAPGSAAVDATAADHLKTIAKALGERPQLKLDLPIAYVASVDTPALAAARLDEQLQAAQKPKAGGTPVPFTQLDPATQVALLRGLYVAAAGGEPKYPDAIAAIKVKAEADAARRDYLRGELLSRTGISTDDLTKLGQQRAQALQAALLSDTGLDPERVFLVESDRAKLEGERVRLEMSLH
jgi:hypothetical protein